MKVYLYIRLSMADAKQNGRKESESISNQRAFLHRYLKEHPEFAFCETEEFTDDGFSGTNGDRPAFIRMMEHLKNGDCKTVLCKDLSRFFRDYTETGEYLEKIFPFLGVRLIAVNDHYDSNEYKGTTGGTDIVMRSIVYSFYSRDLLQKIKTALRAKSKKGQFIGSFSPYGYMKDPKDKHHLIPDPEAAPVVRRIFELAMEGKGTGKIADYLNGENIPPPSLHLKNTYPCRKFCVYASPECCWSARNVRNILKNLEYTGTLVSQRCAWKGIDRPHTKKNRTEDRIIVPNCHEAIVSEEEFRLAQNVIKKVSEYKESKKRSYLLRSLICCGVCGRRMSREVKGGEYYFF